MPAKADTKKVVKGKTAPKTAKKQPVKARRDQPTITSPARVRQYINQHGVNKDIFQQSREFLEKNVKILQNKEVLAIRKDEELTKKYLSVLRFNPGKPPKNFTTKEERDKWHASQFEAHKKTVATAIKKDPKLAIFAKDFNVHEANRKITSVGKRFSRGSYVALAAIIDDVILSILRTAMTVVIGHNKKMLTSAYCVTDDMEANPYFCLFSNIKPFVDARTRLRERAAQNEEEESETQTKGKKGKKAKAEPEPEPEEEEEAPAVRTFTHYVGNIAKSLTGNKDKKNPFQVVRMSSDVKVFCSDIIVAILANLGTALTHLMGNAKTINETLIRNAFATIMTYNGADPSTLLTHVDNALASLDNAKNKTGTAKTAKPGTGKVAKPGKPGKPGKPESEEADESENDADESESESESQESSE